MTKDSYNSKKIYSNVRIVKLDPLAAKLDSVGMRGGASKKLSTGAKAYVKDATKGNLKYSKHVTKAGKRGDFGTPMSSRAVAKELKTGAKESTLQSGMLTKGLHQKLGDKPLAEARKYLKREKIKYRNRAKDLKIRAK